MLTKANIPLSLKQVVKMITNGKICFENAVQRGYEWGKDRQSLLIHSLISGYPVPPVFARKGEDGSYDMLDGKQRLTTIKRFYNNEFMLRDVPTITVVENGKLKEVDINGCYYDNLLSDIRDDLDAVSIVLYYFDGITEDEVSEMFFRLNNGKAVSNGTLTRVKALSKEKITELGQHPIFQMSLTQKALEAYTNEDIVIKALYLLSDHDNLETKNIKEWIWNTEIDKDLELKLYKAMSRLETVARSLRIEEENAKTVKKILTKTHFLSLMPILAKANQDKVKDEIVTKWVQSFYSNPHDSSTSEKYNEACGSGSAKREAVTTRYSELLKSYDKMMKYAVQKSK